MLTATWPEQLVGPLLLLFEQHFELLVGDEAEIDEDLTDASHCHGRSALDREVVVRG